ncbi:polysaccharide lyase family protein [Streptomyces griseorubiginosus]|uniref:polysaccharide lyase family protein n=1 Tax=Streptomyces griseorubiginosus TaxID=67304 RepID=UPI0033AB39A4
MTGLGGRARAGSARHSSRPSGRTKRGVHDHAIPSSEYWAKVDAGSGKYAVPGVLPGTYTLTVYKGELAVHTQDVMVTAGAASTLHTITIAGDPAADTAIWRVGDWNGTPAGFKNASLVTYAHPSDSRAAWTAGPYAIGGSTAAAEPATRTLTVGSYRGNNHTYTYVIPAGRLLPGTNTLRIDAASGSAGGGGYLSPSYGFDALDLL